MHILIPNMTHTQLTQHLSFWTAGGNRRTKREAAHTNSIQKGTLARIVFTCQSPGNHHCAAWAPNSENNIIIIIFGVFWLVPPGIARIYHHSPPNPVFCLSNHRHVFRYCVHESFLGAFLFCTIFNMLFPMVPLSLLCIFPIHLNFASITLSPNHPTIILSDHIHQAHLQWKP